MTESDLSPIMRLAYQSLPEEEREKFLEEYDRLRHNMMRAAISQVIARNQSHNFGKHALVGVK